MTKVINISSNGIKQAIDDLVNENKILQDKVYKLEEIIKEVKEWVYKIQLDNKRLEPIINTDELDGILEILDKVSK